MGTRGVWSLDNVEVKYPVDDWVDINEVALIPAVTASNNVYWLGGSYNNSQSVTPTTDKTDMSTFTTSQLPGDYPAGPANYNSAGTSGTTHGYVCGKYPGNDSKCSKLTYATEVTETQMMNLSSNRGQAVGTNSSTHGYVCGGTAPGSPWDVSVSIVDRITNSADSCERLPACNLVQGGVHQLAACGTQEYGYIGGGTGGSKKSDMSKIEYSTETNLLAPGAFLTFPRSHFASTSNSTHGYWYAGKGYSAPVGGFTTSSTNKTTFATDTTAAIPANMSYLTDFQNANGNTTHALVGGGYWNPSANPGGGSAQAYNTRMDKVTYSNDTISNSPSSYTTVNRRSAGTTGARNNGAGTTYDGARIRWKDNAAQDPDWGVFIGGKGPAGGNTLSKIDFSAEYAKKLDNVPGSDNFSGATMGSSPTKAYLMMGAGPSWPWSQGFSFVFKYTYATTTWGPYTPYTDNRGTYASGVDSSTATTTVNHGGNAQGQNQAYRVTHATDATSTVPALGGDTPGMPSTHSSAGTSNISDGVAYVCGGESSNTSQTDKITFSTDTREKLPASNLPVNKRRHSGSGGPTAAYYFGGDYEVTSICYKFTYSDETYTSAGNFNTGNGPSYIAYGGSTGNTLAGYFYGGNEYATSNIMKILYSTDTTSTLTGKMAEGEQPSPGSYNRIIQNGSTSIRESNRANLIGPFPDTTPTATKSPKPYNTSDKAYYTGGHSASNTGYPNPVSNANLISSTDKLTMASETLALAPGANLPTARYHHKAMSSSLAAYIGGGFNNGSTPNPTSAPGAVGGGLTNMIKIPYATDTTSTMPNLDHVSGALWQGGGNDTKGYFAGAGNAGSGGPYGSRADKITFATDTVEGLSITGFGRGHGAVGVYEGPDATGGGGVYFTQGEYAYPWHPSNGLNSNTTKVMRTSTDTGLDVPSLSMLPYAYLQCHSNPTHWIVYGGMNNGQSSMRSSASKTTWATETDSELPSSTGENLSGAGSAGNNTYGFAGGGRTTSSGDKRSYTMRYTFESDTFEFRPSTHLTNECKFLAGTSAKEHANPDPYYISTPNVI